MTTTQNRLATSGLFQASVGKYLVALSAAQILGIERAERIKADESTGAPILVNRQGEYQIYNLGDLLNVPVNSKQNEGQVLLLESGGVNIGLQVDRVEAIPRHPAPRLVEASLSIGHVRIKQVLLLEGGKALPWVDLDQLFHPMDEEETSEPHLPRPHNTRRSTRLVLIGSTLHQQREVAFGLSAGVVTEIVDVAKVTPLAGVAEHVLGLIEWRGQAVQLLDIARYCGCPTSTPTHPRVVVVNLGDSRRIAFATGGPVKAVDQADEHTIRPDWLGWPNDQVRGVFEFRDMTVVIPDLTKIG